MLSLGQHRPLFSHVIADTPIARLKKLRAGLSSTALCEPALKKNKKKKRKMRKKEKNEKKKKKKEKKGEKRRGKKEKKGGEERRRRKDEKKGGEERRRRKEKKGQFEEEAKSPPPVPEPPPEWVSKIQVEVGIYQVHANPAPMDPSGILSKPHERPCCGRTVTLGSVIAQRAVQMRTFAMRASVVTNMVIT